MPRLVSRWYGAVSRTKTRHRDDSRKLERVERVEKVEKVEKVEAINTYLSELESDPGRVRSLVAWDWIEHTTRSLPARYEASST